jgi:ribosomal protein S18 acetylase RimI-like enzyme
MGFLEMGSGRSEDGSLAFEEIGNAEDLREAARLFAANVDASYIALGDIESGRIDADLRWKADLEAEFEAEYREGRECVDYLAIRGEDGKIMGLMIVGVDTRNKYAVLYDIIIDRDHRGGKAGSTAYGWLETRLKGMGVKRVLLESGINNEKAHAFFGRLGFGKLAIEFMKEI